MSSSCSRPSSDALDNSTEVQVGLLQTKPVPLWSPEEVALWFEWIELPEHKATLITNVVGGQELLELTEPDLVTLGIVRLGQRKALLRRIASLRQSHSSRLGGAAIALSTTPRAITDTDSDSFSPRSADASGAEVVFKIAYNDTVKLLTLAAMSDGQYTLASLRREVARDEFFGCKLCLFYQDADGDLVELSSDTDVQSIVTDSKSRGARYVRLQAVRKENHRQPAATATRAQTPRE